MILSAVPIRRLRHVLASVLLLVVAVGGVAEPVAPRPEATVRKAGEQVAIDVRMTVAVPPALAWEVLTDFDNMAGFLPNLGSSSAVVEAPNLLRVTQKGTARWGPFGIDYESVRRIALQPPARIESTTLSGKISKMRSVSEITGTDGGTQIRYHADAEVDFWLPFGFGERAMRNATADQFTALGREMLRRAAAAQR